MRLRSALLCLCLAGCLAPARQAGAQSHFPVSVEATIGARTGHGGTYVNRTGAALDLVLAHRLRDAPAGTLLGAVTAGVQGPVTSGLECILLPDGGCVEEFPVLVSAGALFGVQRGSARTAGARLLAGPVYHHAPEGEDALGLQGRVDVSTPPLWHAALVASLRHSLLPGYRGALVGITSWGLGVRIQ